MMEQTCADDWESFSDPEIEDLLLDTKNICCQYTVGVTGFSEDETEKNFKSLGLYDDPDVAIESAKTFSKPIYKSMLAMTTDTLRFQVTVEETLVNEDTGESDFIGTIYRSPILIINKTEVI